MNVSHENFQPANDHISIMDDNIIPNTGKSTVANYRELELRQGTVPAVK